MNSKKIVKKTDKKVKSDSFSKGSVSNVPGPNVPGPNVPGPNVPGPNVPGFSVPEPLAPGTLVTDPAHAQDVITLDGHKSDNMDELRKNINNPISDDTLDYIDSQVDRFNETQNLGGKISIHAKLTESVKDLEKEINDMIDIIDKTDINQVSEDLRTSNSMNETTDITSDIMNLEKMIEVLREEDIMQVKIMHYKRIAAIVRKCKAVCDTTKMKIINCK
jgi:hypothetical protein